MEKRDKDIHRLQRYLNRSVELSIRGIGDEDKAPAFRKQLFQVSPCSEGTHLKLFFDTDTFVAVPLECNMSWKDEQFIAFDVDKKLEYRFQF